MVGIKFGNVFKELRIQYGYTQKSFCEAFNANESITTIDSVKNWEQGKSTPEWRTILKLCDFFDCDMDYLFGRISKKTHDTQFVCDETGLSESAVLKLKSFTYDTDISSFLSNLITHREGNTVEGLSVTSLLIKEQYEEYPKVDEIERHKIANSAMGYLFECQSYLQRFIKDQYCVKDNSLK